jgi:hypothetical protein
MLIKSLRGNKDCIRPAKKKKEKERKRNALRACRVAQVVECLPTKCEVLSSNPNTKRKKEML